MCATPRAIKSFLPILNNMLVGVDSDVKEFNKYDLAGAEKKKELFTSLKKIPSRASMSIITQLWRWRTLTTTIHRSMKKE